MALSDSLIQQFAKSVTKPSTNKTTTPTTLTGTVVVSDGKKWVKIDGSEIHTPIETTTEIENGDRVTVDISNHTATVTGNLTNPSASTKTAQKISDDIIEFENVVADRVTADYVSATSGAFNELLVIIGQFKSLSVEEIKALTGTFETLAAKYANIGKLTAESVEALKVETEELIATDAVIKKLSTDELNAVNATINQLQAYNASFKYVNTEVIKAVTANITKLTTEKLDATWANIDYANIGQARFDEFYAETGIIEHLTTEETTATKRLIGVWISGDMIEAGTLKADRILLKDPNKEGLYYQMNINADGVVEGEEVSTEGLDGRVIVAKSITADKMSVSDLYAFRATIGGTEIGDGNIHSQGKETVSSTVRGLYLDKDGQFSVGDDHSHLKFYAEVTTYKVNYDADTDTYTATEEIIENIEGSEVSDVHVTLGEGENEETFPVYFSEENSEYFYKQEKYKLDILADRILFGANSSDKLKDISEYVKIGKYTDPETGEENPCVELSENDSELAQMQTNKRTVYKDGDVEKLSAGQDGITVNGGEVRHVVNTEEYKGQYVWTTRSNGNFGLMWKE